MPTLVSERFEVRRQSPSLDAEKTRDEIEKTRDEIENSAAVGGGRGRKRPFTPDDLAEDETEVDKEENSEK